MASLGNEFLNTDALASIFSFLRWEEILNARCVCQQWKEATTQTLVVSELFVRSPELGHGLKWISFALPLMQTVRIDFGADKSMKFYFADGEGAERAIPRMYHASTPVDLAPIQNFLGLRRLFLRQTRLHGSHPHIFQFRTLETLDLLWNPGLGWDLDMLQGLPNLKKLQCAQNYRLTGDLRSTRMLFKKLVELGLSGCREVTGSLEDVYDFPLLERLNVYGTKVTGDVRTIGPTDLSKLKELHLGDGVYGGGDMQTILETPPIMFDNYQLLKRKPAIFKHTRWCLAEDSDDRYETYGHHSREAPFIVEFVNAGSRMGWRWTNGVSGGACETQWLDPDPLPTDEGFGEYIRELENLSKDVDLYRGFLEPPTREQHRHRISEISRYDFGGW